MSTQRGPSTGGVRRPLALAGRGRRPGRRRRLAAGGAASARARTRSWDVRSSATASTGPGASWPTGRPPRFDGATPGRANTVAGRAARGVRALTATSHAGGLSARQGSRWPWRPPCRTARRPSCAVEYFVDASLARRSPGGRPADRAGSASGPPSPRWSPGPSCATGSAAGAPAPIPRWRPVSPRPSDPFPWHAYFVSAAEAAARLPDLHRPRGLDRDVHQPAPSARSTRRPTTAAWSTRPGTNGCPRCSWPAARSTTSASATRAAAFERSSVPRSGSGRSRVPDLPRPLRVAELERELSPLRPPGTAPAAALKKNHQACPGVLNAAMSDLYWAGRAAHRSFRRSAAAGQRRHLRLHHRRRSPLRGRHAAGRGGRPGGRPVQGRRLLPGRGPLGPDQLRAAYRPAAATRRQRYAASYERQSNGWKEGPGDPQLAEIIQMIEGLAAARAQGLPAVRARLDGTSTSTASSPRWPCAISSAPGTTPTTTTSCTSARPTASGWCCRTTSTSSWAAIPPATGPISPIPPSARRFISVRPATGSNRPALHQRPQGRGHGELPPEFDGRIRELASGAALRRQRAGGHRPGRRPLQPGGLARRPGGASNATSTARVQAARTGSRSGTWCFATSASAEAGWMARPVRRPARGLDRRR